MNFATRPIGGTGLRVSEIGLGGATLGNLYEAVTDLQARATIDAATHTGVSYVDTAPYYGFGLSERRVGDALREAGDIVVSTKVGRLLTPDAQVCDDRTRHGFRSAMPFAPVYDYSYDGVMRSWEASLHRLGLAQVDILYVHDIGSLNHGTEHPSMFRQLVDGGLRALQELRDGGAISAFGIGVNEIPVCLEVMAHARIDAILLAGRYTLLEQAALDALLPACISQGVSVIVGGPYNSGILATGTGGGAARHYDYAPASDAIVTRVGAIEAVAARHGVTLAAAALQFPLVHPQVASVIPGLNHPDRVTQTLAWYREVIPAAFWAELKALSLLACGCTGTRLMRIDAHHHLWDPARGDYGWLTPDAERLYRSFQPSDLAPLLAASGIDATILVQAAPTEAETDYLLALARATPWTLGVVGWIDLDAADAPARIASRAADPLFVGIRPMLQDMADREWILGSRQGIALVALADRGLVFEALVRPDQLGVIATLAERHPELAIVLDHAGKPAIIQAEPDSSWVADLMRLGCLANVACKLSGLLSQAPSGSEAEVITPYIDVIYSVFGPQRLLWGSDWPVLTAVGDYAGWLALAESAIPQHDHDAVFGGNAHRIYCDRSKGPNI